MARYSVTTASGTETDLSVRRERARNEVHVGGTVAAGSLTVLINNQPAARMGDMVVEAGGPNSIAVGEATVMIG